ncbi:MAG TPA: hypothetical protein VF601_11255 [Beijerinckiaceae bacterium]
MAGAFRRISSAMLPRRKLPKPRAKPEEPKRFATFKDYASFAISIAAFTISVATAYYTNIDERYLGSVVVGTPVRIILTLDDTDRAPKSIYDDDNLAPTMQLELTFSNSGNQPYSIQRLLIGLMPQAGDACKSRPFKIGLYAENFESLVVEPGKVVPRRYALKRMFAGSALPPLEEFGPVKDGQVQKRVGCLVLSVLAPNERMKRVVQIPLNFDLDLPSGRIHYFMTTYEPLTHEIYARKSLWKRLLDVW